MSKTRHDADLKDELKLAILIGMVPKEYLDWSLQTGITKGTKLEYSDCRDRIINIVTQKMQMVQPRRMDVGHVDKETDEPNQDDWETQAVDAVGKGGEMLSSWQPRTHVEGLPQRSRIRERQGGSKGYGKGQQQYGKGWDYKGGKGQFGK